MYEYLKYISLAKIIFDNKDLIIGVSILTVHVVSKVGCYAIEYISHCKCGVCSNNRENGEKPIH